MTELAGVIVDVLGPVVLVVGAGFVAGRRLGVEAGSLARLAYWIVGPVFIYDVLSSADLEAALVLRLVAATVATMAVSGAVAGLVARGLGRAFGVAAAIVLTTIYGNVGNFGLAIVAFTFGEEALPLAGVVLLPVHVIGVVVGVAAASVQRVSPWTALRAGLVAPMTLAAVPALIVNLGDVSLPLSLQRPIDLVGAALIPLMLLTLGVQLAGMRRIRADGSAGGEGGAVTMGVPVVGKLVVAPVVAAAVATAVGLDGTPAGVLVLQSAMPTAVFTSLVALEHGLEADLVTSIVVVTTLASLVTLPVVIALVL